MKHMNKISIACDDAERIKWYQEKEIVAERMNALRQKKHELFEILNRYGNTQKNSALIEKYGAIEDAFMAAIEEEAKILISI